MLTNEPLLQLKDLTLAFNFKGEVYPAVRNLNFDLHKGEIVSLVGESGCGKSLTCRAILGLPPENASLKGEIWFESQDLLKLKAKDLEKIRGRKLSMIFQEPMTALNPVLTCGEQVAEVLQTHKNMSLKKAREESINYFEKVGISEPERRYEQYPHQLSGGLRQRVMIAMALIAGPSLLLADEPTTALDSTMCQQILDLIVLQSQKLGMAVLMISHDLETVAYFSERVGVMYAGLLVEMAKTSDLFANPLHPYTEGLLLASPARLAPNLKRLPVIKGSVPSLTAMPKGCPFAPRCSWVEKVCEEEVPQLKKLDDRWVACHRI
ncbi:MAG: ABC transporter ATP-binding protein [Desulfovibrionaceae bacterium]|nr:ABC transporter ATP-binding protein [Desulfovibrionaceae bacterium]